MKYIIKFSTFQKLQNNYSKYYMFPILIWLILSLFEEKGLSDNGYILLTNSYFGENFDFLNLSNTTCF